MFTICTPKCCLFALAILYLCMAYPAICKAQGSGVAKRPLEIHKSHHSGKTAFPPKAILVQMRSEQRRIQYFMDNNRPYEARQVKKEASIIRKVMKNDFEDNLSFCPVYYFMDTNAYLVKEQRFDSVLSTAEGLPVRNCAIRPGDTDYYIVYYGYPDEQMDQDASPNHDFNIGNGEVMGKGLIFLDYKYQQKDFYYRFEYWDLFHTKDMRHEYRSSKYDMEYYPFAAQYETDLLEKFDPVMVTKTKVKYARYQQ
jgi:hypothetical protein